jgi:hypothetical protein
MIYKEKILISGKFPKKQSSFFTKRFMQMEIKSVTNYAETGVFLKNC